MLCKARVAQGVVVMCETADDMSAPLAARLCANAPWAGQRPEQGQR
jgi:hypothetical protein